MNRSIAGLVIAVFVLGCEAQQKAAIPKSIREGMSTMGQQSTPVVATSPEATAAEGTNENADSNADVKLVAVKVEGMMCPHACLPQVKALITKRNDIESIELTPQKNADTIDNPVVLVKYRGNLNKDETTQAILDAGFESVEYTDQ